MKIIDASDSILGRMASVVAKELLNGEKVTIINAENSLISGSKKDIVQRYRHRINRKSIINPARFGPFFPKRPEEIVRRTIRGMLPYKKARGRKAFKNLRVYPGVPPELEGRKAETIEEANLSKLSVPKYIRLGELSRNLGSNYEVL